MEPRADHPEPPRSEDEIARELIERISREVDLAFGRKPLVPESEAQAESNETDEADEEPREELVADASEQVAEEPAERSEEDVARELIERISREVDEEERG